jgi:hypothetical protein
MDADLFGGQGDIHNGTLGKGELRVRVRGIEPIDSGGVKGGAIIRGLHLEVVVPR